MRYVGMTYMLKISQGAQLCMGRDVVDHNGECATGDLFPVPIMIIDIGDAPDATAAALSKLRVEQIHLHITYVRGE